MSIAWGEITAEEILSPINGTLFSGKRHTVLAGVSTDSRKIRPGELFWALKGKRYDGHEFVEKALDSGAAGIVVQEGYDLKISRAAGRVVIAVADTLKALGDLAGWWRRRHNVRVVAITGSAGKTTTKEMTATILDLGSRTSKSRGNFNNLIGLPLTLLGVDERHRNSVLEMGMNRPGEIARLTEIADPDIGIITNVGMAHLEGVGDLEGVAMAKAELIDKISSNGYLILNGDDRLLMNTAAAFQKEVITFGVERENDVRAANIQDMGRDGISLDIQYQGNSWPVRLKVPGYQNVSNALAAAAAALCLNEPTENIIEGLGRFAGVKGRFMVARVPGGAIVVDDTYNANPLSLKAALYSIQSLADGGGRIFVGLGEMMELGDAAVSAHLEAGRKVAELNPHLFLAMGEHAQEMVKGAVVSGVPLDHTEVVKTHMEMVRRIRDELREGDLIFLKGSLKMGLFRVVDGLKKPPRP